MSWGSFFTKIKAAKRQARDLELLRNSKFLDPIWYRQNYVDLRGRPIDVAQHYLAHGAAEGRDPHASFSTKFYLENNPDVVASGMNPLVHYILYGANEGRLTSPAPAAAPSNSTDRKNDVVLNETVKAKPQITLERRIYEKRKEIVESGFFDAGWYLKRYKDVARAGADPLAHFIDFGSPELRSPGPEFDARWYAEEYPEALAQGQDPLGHYLSLGRQQGLRPKGSAYERWCKKFDTITPQDRSDILSDIEQNDLPAADVVIYFESEERDLVANTVKALSKQIFGSWNAFIILSPDFDQASIEAARAAVAADERISIVSNPADLDNPAKSAERCLILVAGGVVMREHGFYMLASAARASRICMVYSDEDTLDGSGQRIRPIFKPQYSPLLQRTTNYIGRVVLLRGLIEVDRVVHNLVTGEASVRSVVDGLLASLEDDRVHHIPSILYHNLRLPPLKGEQEPVIWDAAEDVLPSFSIIIPTKDKLEFLKPCVESIVRQSLYPREKVEIIVVDNGSTELETFDYLRHLADENKAKILQDSGKFNFSRLNNVAASQALNDVLLFVNNDTVVNDPLWLERIATFVVQADVGAVGAKLLFPDRTVQHGGIILGIQGVAAHDMVGLEESDENARLDETRELSAVTGACLAMRRSVFAQLGGFDTTAAVAFNDVLLCLAAREAGYRNIYIRQPLLIHFESKSRGYDEKPEKVALFRREARYARRRFNALFNDDPYYNPNLCLQHVNELGFPPRRSKPWRALQRNWKKLKILFLTSTAEVGHGVAVVISLQAAYLVARGHEVYIGGPKKDRELEFPGSKRIYLDEPAQAAVFAVEAGIDCIVVETPPFFSIVRWLAHQPPTLFLDHGEPPAEFFAEVKERRDITAEKQLCSVMATKIFAISQSVRAEGTEERAGVIPNGNSNLMVWKESLRTRRMTVRATFDWSNKVVVLNVCRFRAAERRYKGVDRYAEVLHEFGFARPALAKQLVFVLAGKADPNDVLEMRDAGIEVFENITDEEMSDLYLAADIYMNFSRWEGYNLGIGQALAMGLPVIASDIPAHRAFPITTSSDTLTAVESLSNLAEFVMSHGLHPERKPIVTEWEQSLALLEREIIQLCEVRSPDTPKIDATVRGHFSDVSSLKYQGA